MTKADRIWQVVTENAMSVQEAADYLGITRGGLWKATRNGALRQTKNGLYIRPDLDEYRATVKTGRPKKDN